MVRLRLRLLIAVLVIAPSSLTAQSLVAGDTLHLRLLDRLGSDHRAPKTIHALVIAPLASDGRVVLPPGSVATGRVTGAGMEHNRGKRHWIGLQLDSVLVPTALSAADTLRAGIALRVAAVDDSRESIDPIGRIVGPPIPSIVRSKKDWAILVLGVFHPVGALVLAATLEGENRERHRKVALNAGTELTAVVTAGTKLARWPTWAPPPKIIAGANADSIAALSPLYATLRAGGPPGDVISIALIGSAAQVDSAFAAAGWTRAVPMSLRSDFVTFVKAAGGRGYEAQPMSELAIDRREPDREYEKVADTFAKRHHLRMWRWPAGASTTGDSTLWLIAATHDVGVMFLTKQHTFTHRVDPHIDDERDKVVSDLVAANAVRAMSYVRRTAPTNGATVNGGRSQAVTDWRMAVLILR
jgi:hypothetical protein